jgi:tRNA threonylcarbamoyladenosine biosynthesis protein TsaE
MSEISAFQFTSHSDQDTADFARLLVPFLTAGDVILLHGDIGAGKSHFSRSLIQSVMDPIEDVPSPTFTLVQTYDTQIGEIWHADLYRLSDVDETYELGLIDAFEEAICLIEWPDRLGDEAPQNALHITLAAQDENTREITIQGLSDRWANTIQKVRNDWG